MILSPEAFGQRSFQSPLLSCSVLSFWYLRPWLLTSSVCSLEGVCYNLYWWSPHYRGHGHLGTQPGSGAVGRLTLLPLSYTLVSYHSLAHLVLGAKSIHRVGLVELFLFIQLYSANYMFFI